jgi:hypothetical protein
MLNAFSKTALAALMMLSVCRGTVQADGTPCNGAKVNYNIPFFRSERNMRRRHHDLG